MLPEAFQKMTEVEHLLLNAQLKQEIEPYVDESVTLVDTRRMPTRLENAFLASMLAWERAPILPIRQWFEPELQLPVPQKLTELQLSEILNTAILMLFEKGISLQYTEHLSDRELYRLILRDILSAEEKRVQLPGRYLHWQCIDSREEVDDWLRYYASDDERADWEDQHCRQAPYRVDPPHPRYVPRPSN